LKSIDQTSFGARQAESGVLPGATRRLRRRGRVSPARSKAAPIVLAAGQVRSG